MKKTFLSLLFLVLLAGILTGCCSHEFAPADCEHPETCQKCGEVQGESLGHNWLDATCETAKTCTRCGKTQGEPLGHDWLDATCDTPLTCTRCAVTQGESLGHDFGSWTFTDTTMTHTCQRCDFADTQELDRAVQLGSYLSGHWDLDYVNMEGRYLFSDDFSKPGFTLDFREDGTVSGTYLYEDAAGTWGFQAEYQGKSYEGGYTESEDFNYFNFYLDLSDDTAVYCQYQIKEEPLLFLILGNDVQVCLVKESGMDAKLAGTAWKSDSPEGYSLVLREDHTFTATSPDETITGQWMTRPFQQYTDGGPLSCSISMWYEKDGEILALSNNIRPKTAGETDRNLFTPYQIGVQFQDIRIYMNVTTELDIKEQQNAKDEIAKALTGTWTSINYHSWTGPNDSAIYTDLLGDYTISFYSDGTFSGSVGREITGTWETDGEFNYTFYINEDQTHHSGRLTYHDDSYTLDILEFEGDSNLPYTQMQFLSLIHFPIDGIPDVYASIPGSYTSCQKEKYNKEADEYICTDTTEYTMTFHADGTFSGQLDIPVTGTWAPYSFRKDKLDTFFEYDSNYSCELWLNFDQEGFDSRFDYRSDGSFSIRYLWSTDDRVNYIFK